MAQQPPQMPSDTEWEQDEALFTEDLTRKARASDGIYKAAIEPKRMRWDEDYLRFYFDLLERAAREGGIYRRALEDNERYFVRMV